MISSNIVNRLINNSKSLVGINRLSNNYTSIRSFCISTTTAANNTAFNITPELKEKKKTS